MILVDIGQKQQLAFSFFVLAKKNVYDINITND